MGPEAAGPPRSHAPTDSHGVDADDEAEAPYIRPHLPCARPTAEHPPRHEHFFLMPRAVPRTDEDLLGIAYEHDPRYYLWSLLDREMLHGDVTSRSRVEAFPSLIRKNLKTRAHAFKT